MVTLLYGLALLGQTAVSGRSDLVLNQGWELAQVSSIADAVPTTGWERVSVPHVLFAPTPDPRTALWYRRKLDPAPQSRAFLRFDSAGKAATVFVDGKRVEQWMNSFTPHEVEITKFLKGKRSAQIAIRCLDRAATYADGFVPPAGSPEAAIRGKVLWPLGGYHDAMGLALPVTLQTRPSRFIDDAETRIVTSLRKGRIDLVGKVDGGTGLVKASTVDRDGKVRQIGTAKIGVDGTYRFSAPFAKPRLWSPEDPHLYRLNLTLVGAKGETLDRTVQRFGFREVWVKGPNFYLNGVRRNLLATSTWPLAEPLPRAELKRRMLEVKKSNAIAFRPHIGPWQKDLREIADEIGLLIVEEGPLYTDGSGMYGYSDPRFWRNYQEVLGGLVGWNFNHPSVVMWSLGNEILFMGNQRYEQALPQRLGDLARHVRKLDPTRPLTFEADLDPDGAFDVIGLHYPHEIPSQHAYPVVADWLGSVKQTEAGGGLLGTTGSSFKWDRKKPLYIGEYLWAPYGDYSVGSVYYGPEAYRDRGYYHGRAQIESWYDQTIAYRRSEVTGVSPWTAFGFGIADDNVAGIQKQREFYKPIAAFPRNRAYRVASGKTLHLDYDVFNSSAAPRSMVLEVQVGDLVQKKSIRLGTGENTAASFEFVVPKSMRAVPASSTLREGSIVHDRRQFAVETEFNYYSKPTGKTVVKISRLEDFDQLSVPTAPATQAIVEARALDLKRVPEAEGLPLVGGASVDTKRLRAFLEAGGTLVVKEQTSLAALGLPVSLVDHMSTMAFPDDPEWPSMMHWGRDMIVSRHQISRNGASGLRSLTTSGGPQSLAQAPIALMRVGKGRVLFVQALVGEKADEDIAAGTVLAMATDKAVSEPPVRPGMVAFVGDDPVLLARLQSVSLNVGLVSDAPVAAPISGLVLAGGKLPDWLRARVLAEKIPVLWFVRSEADYAAEPSLAQPGLSWLGQGSTTAWLDRDPLLTGVTREELTLLTQPTGWNRQTRPFTETCPGVLVGPVRADVPQVVPAKDFSGKNLEKQGERLLMVRNTTVSARVSRSEEGWAILRVMGEPKNGAVLRLTVNRSRWCWFGPQSDRSTLVHLTKGDNSIEVAVENAADWGTSGPQFVLEGVSIGAPATLPSGVRMLSTTGTLAAWEKDELQVVATTLGSPAMDANRLKAERLFSAICANLGMNFLIPDVPVGSALPLGRFTIEGGAYNTARPDGIELRSAGTASLDVWVANAGSYMVEVDAESSPAGGEHAELAIQVDGAEIGRKKCVQAQTRTYVLGPVALQPGKRKVGVTFTNDGIVGSEDRNLMVRAVRLVRKAGP